MQTWTHILEECALRHYEYPQPFDNNLNDTNVPKTDWPGLEIAIEAYRTLKLPEGTFLVKYSKYGFLLDTLKDGKICINPASSFSDPSLNRAVRDSELELKIFNARKAKKETLHTNNLDFENPVSSVGSDACIVQSNTDYYVYCLSSYWTPRLFGDFEANSCLIIKNPDIFLKRLIKALVTKFPAWQCFGTGVKYFDPLNCSKVDVDIFSAKQFRFAYQKEYRVVCYPNDPVQKLERFFINMGNLEDICELISLENND